MVVPAPGLFSTIIACPVCSVILADKALAITSEIPPVANPTINRMGLDG